MKHTALESSANARHLTILGGFHPNTSDDTPESCKTLLLLGPDEPDFWPNFTQSPEWNDGKPDPMDRWSSRVITAWATELRATALFPFGGAPFQPFYRWALRTGRIHSSPVQFLVHDQAGLFVSFRGALALTDHIDLPVPPPNPCQSCSGRPCATACLSGALQSDGYDVPKCKTFLQTQAGSANMTSGCNVRRACPVSKGFGRADVQSAYHMRQFTGSPR